MGLAARVALVLLLVAVLLPALASACPLCKDAKADTDYPGGTASLSSGFYYSILLMVAAPFPGRRRSHLPHRPGAPAGGFARGGRIRGAGAGPAARSRLRGSAPLKRRAALLLLAIAASPPLLAGSPELDGFLSGVAEGRRGGVHSERFDRERPFDVHHLVARVLFPNGSDFVLAVFTKGVKTVPGVIPRVFERVGARYAGPGTGDGRR